MLFMSAAPIFTCSISSVLSNTWHLSSFPFLWLSVNQSNIKFADLSSEITAILVLSSLTYGGVLSPGLQCVYHPLKEIGHRCKY